jgi:hypothetical protein
VKHFGDPDLLSDGWGGDLVDDGAESGGCEGKPLAEDGDEERSGVFGLEV